MFPLQLSWNWLCTQSSSGQLVCWLVGLCCFTWALHLTQLFPILWLWIIHLLAGRTKHHLLAQKGQSRSETEGLFVGSSWVGHILNTHRKEGIWWAAEKDLPTLQHWYFCSLSIAHLPVQSTIFWGWHLLIRVIIALMETSMLRLKNSYSAIISLPHNYSLLCFYTKLVQRFKSIVHLFENKPLNSCGTREGNSLNLWIYSFNITAKTQGSHSCLSLQHCRVAPLPSHRKQQALKNWDRR